MNIFSIGANFIMGYVKNTSGIMVVQLLLPNEDTFYKDYSSITAVRQEE